MDINRNNYEAYLLDYVEGRLSVEEQQAVRDFLLQNPDLEEGERTGTFWKLEKARIPFPGKEMLRKEIPKSTTLLTQGNFDLFSIARLEGDLNEQQERAYESLMAGNEKLSREWMKWQKTKLTAESIQFPGKDRLKKKKGLNNRVIWLSVFSSAAAIALVITLLRIDFFMPEPELTEQISSLQPEGMNQSTEQEVQDLPQDQQQDEPSAMFPPEEEATLASNPVTLSIRKHQDPPELTGMKKGSTDTKGEADTTRNIRQQQTEPRPVRIARLDHSIRETVDRGHYDQIKPLEIPATSIHLTSLSLSQLANFDLQEMVEDYTEQNDFSIWTIANAGIKGINRITGADLSLIASRDDDGDVSGLRFKSRRFSLATPLDRSE